MHADDDDTDDLASEEPLSAADIDALREEAQILQRQRETCLDSSVHRECCEELERIEAALDRNDRVVIARRAARAMKQGS